MSSDAMFQPPNPNDLRRRPPATPECARVRGMLRDYADGDLEVGQASFVDEHVSECRACGVELVRAEHEVLRLRQAFGAIGAAEAPLRHDFAQRCVEQLVLSGGAAEPIGQGVDDGDTLDGARGGERDGLRFGPAALLLTSLGVLFVLGVAMRVFQPAGDEPVQVARFVVLSADDSYDSQRRQLVAGDSIGERQGLWVREGGGARIDWHDSSRFLQPAATMEVSSGELLLADGTPLLVDGKLLIQTNRSVAIPMIDGSRIELGVGEYVLAAEIPSDMLDDKKFEPGETSFDELPKDLRIQIEVRSGEAARIVRVGEPRVAVVSGATGVYGGGGGVEILGGGPLAESGGGGKRTEAAQPPQAEVMTLSGQVIGPGGFPSGGTEVLLAFASQSQVVHAWEMSNANGGFEVEPQAPCDSNFAIVLALPAAQNGFSFVPPHPISLLRQGGVAHLSRPVVLFRATELSGVVRDNSGQVLVGAQIRPCIVDQLFSSVMTLVGHETTTNGNGFFSLDRLPSVLSHHQHLALLIWSPGVEPTVVPVPARGAPSATPLPMQITARQVSARTIVGLAPNKTFSILEEVPGLPPSTAATSHVVVSDAQGRAELSDGGRGQLWLRVGSALFPKLRRLTVDHSVATPVWRPEPEMVQLNTRFRAVQNLVGTDLYLANGFRYEHLEVQPVESIVTSQALRVTDDLNRPIESCEVFAVTQSICRGLPDVRLLGMTNPAGVLSLGRVAPHEDVYVIGPAGEAAWLSRPKNLGPSVAVTIQSTGRVLLGEDLRPAPGAADQVREITFRRDLEEVLTGTAPTFVRFASAETAWEVFGLPPGRYTAEVDGQSLAVDVPSHGFVTLTQE